MSDNLFQVVVKVYDILKENGALPFLIGESMKEGAVFKEADRLQLGVRAEEIEGKTDEITAILKEEFDEVVAIELPYNFIRGWTIADGGFSVLIAGYFVMGEMRYCPFTKKPGNLIFPNELLEKMKKKRVGSKHIEMPTPQEDYLNHTFKDGSFAVEEI
jgi:hypothetical protein